jgi:hypothetical protein
MMLKMHTPDNDIVGKIRSACSIVANDKEISGSCFVRIAPASIAARNPQAQLEDKSDEQLAQFTPSMNRSSSLCFRQSRMYLYIIIRCFGVKTVQAIADSAEPMLVQNGGESVFARAKMRCFPIVAIEPPNRMNSMAGWWLATMKKFCPSA